MAQELRARVKTLEDTMQDFIRRTERGFAKMQDAIIDLRNERDDFNEEMRASREDSTREMEEFKAEMRASREASAREMEEFKAEMRASREDSTREMEEFKAEMRASREASAREMEEFKAEMRTSREASAREMKEFKAEMRASREASAREMEEFKAEMRTSREASALEMQKFKNEMAQKWGNLANRLGTLAEDVVAPNIVPLAQKYFNCSGQPLVFSTRRVQTHAKDRGRVREFDAYAVYDDVIILSETKSTPRVEYMDDFLTLIDEFFEYCPEYTGKRLIPIFASLRVEDHLVRYATRKKIYVMALKGDTMDLLNFQDIS